MGARLTRRRALVLAVALLLLLLILAPGLGVGEPRVYVRIWGLREGDHVDIVCGRLGLDQALFHFLGVETAATGFTLRINGSRLCVFP